MGPTLPLSRGGRTACESRPLCALGWPPGRQGTIWLLFVWGKLRHPIAIIYGRKYLMFLEEVGYRGTLEGRREGGSPLVPSTLNPCVLERVMHDSMGWGIRGREMNASSALVPGTREGIAYCT